MLLKFGNLENIIVGFSHYLNFPNNEMANGFPHCSNFHIVKWLIGLPFFVKGVPKTSVITTYSGTKCFCTPSSNKF